MTTLYNIGEAIPELGPTGASARVAKNIARAQLKRDVMRALSKGHKLCVKCNQEKALFSFTADKKNYSGYSSWCKDCRKEANKQRYLREKQENIEGTNNDEANGE